MAPSPVCTYHHLHKHPLWLPRGNGARAKAKGKPRQQEGENRDLPDGDAFPFVTHWADAGDINS